MLGICNGFQVIAEAGLVPGALLRNRGLRFLGRDVTIAAERLAEVHKMAETLLSNPVIEDYSVRVVS